MGSAGSSDDKEHLKVTFRQQSFMISALTFYSDDPSLNPYKFEFVKIAWKERKREKRGRGQPFLNQEPNTPRWTLHDYF